MTRSVGEPWDISFWMVLHRWLSLGLCFGFIFCGEEESLSREGEAAALRLTEDVKMVFFLRLLEFWQLNHPQTFWAKTLLGESPAKEPGLWQQKLLGLALLFWDVFRGEQPCLHLGRLPACVAPVWCWGQLCQLLPKQNQWPQIKQRAVLVGGCFSGWWGKVRNLYHWGHQLQKRNSLHFWKEHFQTGFWCLQKEIW